MMETHAVIEVHEGELPTRGLQSVSGVDIKSCHYLISVDLCNERNPTQHIYSIIKVVGLHVTSWAM